MTETDWETQPRQDRRAGKINTRDSTIRLSRSERFSQGENSISNWAEVIDCLSLTVQYCKAGEKNPFIFVTTDTTLLIKMAQTQDDVKQRSSGSNSTSVDGGKGRSPKPNRRSSSLFNNEKNGRQASDQTQPLIQNK